MALTLAYSVTGMKVKDEVNAEGVTLSNAVCQTFWKVVGTDSNDNTGEFSGATPFTAVVEADAGYKSHIESQIQKIIDQDLQTEAALPWAPDVTPPVPDDGLGLDDPE